MEPHRVLVADDEPAVLRLLTRVLERSGRAATGVEDGDAAIVELKGASEPFDLLVLDGGIRPAGMIPVLEAAAAAATRVIVISGRGLENDEQALLDRCGGSFLAKPFSPDGLLAAIDAGA